MLTSVVMPVAFFCVLLPLYAEGLHYELWQVYYWLVQCALAAFMSESCVRLGFGDPSRPLRWFVLVCVSVVPATAAAFFHMPCRAEISLRNLALGISLLAPALLKFLASCWQNLALGPPACSVLFFLWGALPTMLSVTLYVFLLGAGLVEDIGHMVLAMVLWIAAPISAKALGSTLSLGYPKARFAGKVFTNFYVDLAFGTLGLVLFVRSPIASVTYAASIIPALGIHMVRGSRCALRCCGRNRAVPLHVSRVVIFVEACGAVVGRAVAYTLYFCMRIEGLIVDPQLLYPRPSLSNPGGSRTTMSVQIFHRGEGSFDEIAAAVFGFLSLWVFFAIFCVVLPRVWCQRDTGSVFVVPEPQSHQAPGDRNEDTGQLPIASPSSGWVLGGDAAETREQQYNVLHAFLAQHRTVFLSLILFQFMISISAVNLAEAFIFLDPAAGARYTC